MAIRQHHKGKKRPRAWHRGRAAGAEQVKALTAIEQAEARHEQQSASAAAQHVMHLDAVDMWTKVDRQNPPGGLAWFTTNERRSLWARITRSSTTGTSGPRPS